MYKQVLHVQQISSHSLTTTNTRIVHLLDIHCDRRYILPSRNMKQAHQSSNTVIQANQDYGTV